MASTIKVNNIQNQCGANIINESANTITIGASGDTISLASGASQTGFGRTGTVDWQTGSIKTATFTAVNGEGYFANTSGGAFTMNLPAGSAGAIVSVVDYTNTFQTNALTVAPNGSQKIGGIAASNTLSTEGQSVTFVYVDDTEGWKNIQDSTSNVIGNPFLLATGGTITTCGNCKIHTFTGPGTFTVCKASSTAAENIVSYLVIAGGAAGGSGGGGGAGGYRELKSPLTPYTASPLDGYPSSPNRVTVTAQAYPITVGAGGAGYATGPNTTFNNGSNSIFSTITSAGGGAGGNHGPNCVSAGRDGGSGGGGTGTDSGAGAGGTGNTPPVTPAQGTNGGTIPGPTPGSAFNGGGGGGATAAGCGTGSAGVGANGGAGATTSINGTPTARAGGGGGSSYTFGGGGSPGSGGTGGGGAGGSSGGTPAGVAGTVNTGSGGGGRGTAPNGVGNPTSGAGGSGIVIIRYKYQ
jgi:hypothetical protein